MHRSRSYHSRVALRSSASHNRHCHRSRKQTHTRTPTHPYTYIASASPEGRKTYSYKDIIVFRHAVQTVERGSCCVTQQQRRIAVDVLQQLPGMSARGAEDGEEDVFIYSVPQHAIYKRSPHAEPPPSVALSLMRSANHFGAYALAKLTAKRSKARGDRLEVMPCWFPSARFRR